jgi:hypothetical protein
MDRHIDFDQWEFCVVWATRIYDVLSAVLRDCSRSIKNIVASKNMKKMTVWSTNQTIVLLANWFSAQSYRLTHWIVNQPSINRLTACQIDQLSDCLTGWFNTIRCNAPEFLPLLYCQTTLLIKGRFYSLRSCYMHPLTRDSMNCEEQG